jgi:hypothetical protein
MKTRQFLSSAATLLLFLAAPSLLGAQTYKSPVEYMQAISKQYRGIMKDFWSYTSSVAHGKSARKVENRRNELLQGIKEAKSKIKSMPPYEGEKSYRDSAAAFLDMSYHVLNDDYGKILNMEEIAEQSYDAMEAYLTAQDIANEKLEQAGDRFEMTERKFAEKFSVNLIETKDELAKKLEAAGKVNDYHRIIYLIFFKCFKQEAYMLDAMQRKDINAIEQNRNSLIKYAEEGLAKLEEVKPYNGDGSLITACKQMLQFYKKECSEKIPKISGFYMKQENFDKVKKAFDAKRESERTKADIDQYNNAIKEINTAGTDYNNAVTSLSNERSKLLTNWNNTSQGFLDRHTPKK